MVTAMILSKMKDPKPLLDIFQAIKNGIFKSAGVKKFREKVIFRSKKNTVS
jgi:hypothetical protein